MDAEIKKAGLQSAGTLNREVPRTLGYRLCFTIALFFQKSSVFLSDKSDGADEEEERKKRFAQMNWMALSAETRGVVRDKNGVPVEWTLLRTGDNPICQEGQDGAIRLSGEDMRQIMEYHRKKGELIPIDSEHYLYELANRKKLDEAETARLFPGGVAAMGYGELALKGEELRVKVQWTQAAYEMLKEKIYKYYSPVLRGIEKGPLRVTSVAMTNIPAINNLDALAARAESNKPGEGAETRRKSADAAG